MHTQRTDNDFINSVIAKCNICYVAVTTPENKPYVIPMNFGFRDNIFYFHGASEGKIIDCLNANPNVCITLCIDNEIKFQNAEVACSYGMKSKSVIASGKVQFVSDLDEKREILNIIMANYSGRKFEYGNPAVKNVNVWKVPVDEISCKEFGVRS